MLGEVLTAIVTPFREDGSVDLDAFRRLCTHLVENGSDGVVVAGHDRGVSDAAPTTSGSSSSPPRSTTVGDRATVIAGTGDVLRRTPST